MTGATQSDCARSCAGGSWRTSSRGRVSPARARRRGRVAPLDGRPGLRRRALRGPWTRRGAPVWRAAGVLPLPSATPNISYAATVLCFGAVESPHHFGSDSAAGGANFDFTPVMRAARWWKPWRYQPAKHCFAVMVCAVCAELCANLFLLRRSRIKRPWQSVMTSPGGGWPWRYVCCFAAGADSANSTLLRLRSERNRPAQSKSDDLTRLGGSITWQKKNQARRHRNPGLVVRRHVAALPRYYQPADASSDDARRGTNNHTGGVVDRDRRFFVVVGGGGGRISRGDGSAATPRMHRSSRYARQSKPFR